MFTVVYDQPGQAERGTLSNDHSYSRLAQLIDRSWAQILDAGISRRARRGCRYHAYLPDRLTDLNVSLPADVAADVSDAERGVQDLNTSGPQLASLEALAHLLLRAEAVASSRI